MRIIYIFTFKTFLWEIDDCCTIRLPLITLVAHRHCISEIGLTAPSGWMPPITASVPCSSWGGHIWRNRRQLLLLTCTRTNAVKQTIRRTYCIVAKDIIYKIILTPECPRWSFRLLVDVKVWSSLFWKSSRWVYTVQLWNLMN